MLSQIRNFCNYNDLPLELKQEYFDLVVKSYFTVVGETNGASPKSPQATPPQSAPPKIERQSATLRSARRQSAPRPPTCNGRGCAESQRAAE